MFWCRWSISQTRATRRLRSRWWLVFEARKRMDRI